MSKSGKKSATTSASTTSPLITSTGAGAPASASAAVAAARAESAAHSGDFGPKLQAMRATFRQGRSKPLDFRLQQLRQLEKMVRENGEPLRTCLPHYRKNN
jgi:hypothetical protein